MSVQLIVYPQNYEGQINAISSDANEFVVNGINFSGLDSSSSYDLLTTDISDVIINAPATITNIWYRFRSTILGTPTLPIVTAGNLVLNSTTTLTISGVYQSLSNLTVGQIYNVTIDISTTASGSILVNSWNGTTQTPTQIFAANTSQINASFTASDTNITLMIYYYNTVADNVTISTISVVPSGIVPSGAIQLLEDGQVICDLYEDEDLPLTLSVDDFKNVAEKVQSYSKAFNLPSTKRNAKIFDHIFEITRSYDGLIFNPYKRTKCVLKQDGFILFEGYLRMLDVTDKEGEISYNVNLYSEVIALADTLKDRAFRDLSFSELEHEYNRTQITASWNDGGTGITYTNPSTSGFRDANSTVKYPFVDWNHQIATGGSSGSGNSATVGNPEFTALEQIFRPFINIKYLIDRIFEASDFTYESAFFNTTDFEELYMDFNWGADNTPTEVGVTDFLGTWRAIWPLVGTTFSNYANTTFSDLDIVPFTLFSNVQSVVPPNYNTLTNTITSTVDNETYSINYNYIIENIDTVSRTIECQWLYNSTPINYSGVQSIPAGGTYSYTGSFTKIMTLTGDTLVAQFKSDDATGTKVRQYESGTTITSTVIFSQSISAVTTNTFLQTLRGELGQWDFLKGLITMFNLVTLVDEDNPNNIIIEPYSDVFIPTTTGGQTLANRGVEHDWTDKIDVSEIKLTPLTDLNRKTMFKFVEDDDDYSFNQYKNNVGGHLYGSQKYNAGNEFNILDGEDEIVAEPFAATLVKPLMDNFPEFITPAIYAMNDDVSEGFENSPRIMYNNGIKPTGASYYIPEQNGVVSSNETNFLQFSHLTDIPTITSSPPLVTDTRDFHFGICQLMPGLGTATPNNLFNLYWLPYYAELYNPNTRTMTIKVNLSPADINTFRFNDKVFIKNRVFRCNRIDYKPNDLATVEFILIP
tara:strand:+ start:2260 stop:5037 length:2778 start_codon:yes stop_codon:yes gene_type:complete